MSETRYTIVYRSEHAEVLLGPLGFHAQCMDGCDWTSRLEHAKYKARMAADQHDQEHTR